MDVGATTTNPQLQLEPFQEKKEALLKEVEQAAAIFPDIDVESYHKRLEKCVEEAQVLTMLGDTKEAIINGIFADIQIEFPFQHRQYERTLNSVKTLVETLLKSQPDDNEYKNSKDRVTLLEKNIREDKSTFVSSFASLDKLSKRLWTEIRINNRRLDFIKSLAEIKKRIPGLDAQRYELLIEERYTQARKEKSENTFDRLTTEFPFAALSVFEKIEGLKLLLEKYQAQYKQDPWLAGYPAEIESLETDFTEQKKSFEETTTKLIALNNRLMSEPRYIRYRQELKLVEKHYQIDLKDDYQQIEKSRQALIAGTLYEGTENLGKSEPYIAAKGLQLRDKMLAMIKNSLTKTETLSTAAGFISTRNGLKHYQDNIKQLLNNMSCANEDLKALGKLEKKVKIYCQQLSLYDTYARIKKRIESESKRSKTLAKQLNKASLEEIKTDMDAEVTECDDHATLQAFFKKYHKKLETVDILYESAIANEILEEAKKKALEKIQSIECKPAIDRPLHQEKEIITGIVHDGEDEISNIQNQCGLSTSPTSLSLLDRLKITLRGKQSRIDETIKELQIRYGIARIKKMVKFQLTTRMYEFTVDEEESTLKQSDEDWREAERILGKLLEPAIEDLRWGKNSQRLGKPPILEQSEIEEIISEFVSQVDAFTDLQELAKYPLEELVKRFDL